MDVAKEQIKHGCNAVGQALAQTAPTFAVVVWLISVATETGFGEVLVQIVAPQPVRALIALITGM